MTFPETHKQGHVSIENLEMIKEQDLQNADFGVQISDDGRVWCCINGIAFVRFKPRRGAHGTQAPLEMKLIRSQLTGEVKRGLPPWYDCGLRVYSNAWYRVYFEVEWSVQSIVELTRPVFKLD